MSEKESKWWEGYNEGFYDNLKTINVPLGLLNKQTQNVLKKIPPEDLEYYSNWGEWVKIENGVINNYLTYRLRPDWKKPKEEKKGHWEYYYVYKKYNKWWCRKEVEDLFTHCILGRADEYVGFGGVEFKEKPNAWVMSVSAFYDEETKSLAYEDYEGLLAGDRCTGKPATPNRVRFWVEG